MSDKTPQAPGFNSEAAFTIDLRREKKSVICRFPSDEEYAARQRSMKTVITSAGVGRSTTETEGMEESASDLLEKIQTGGDRGLDGAQACAVIERLCKAEAEQPSESAEGYVIPLMVCGAKVSHEIRVPTEKQSRAYGKSAFKFVDLRHGRQELKTNLTAIGDYYDSLVVRTEGYDSTVPLAHKVAVISELSSILAQLDAEPDPENF